MLLGASSQPLAATFAPRPDDDELLRHRVDQLDELRRQQAERHAAERQPHHAGALPGAGVVGVASFSSRGWPRKITPKNLTIV